MQRVRVFALLCATLVLVLVDRAATTTSVPAHSVHPANSTAGSAAAETRGLWVVRTTLTSPERIAEMVRAASRNGFNAIFVQVRGRGDAFYRSAIEPRSTELDRQPATFDPLAVTLDLAHKAGLRVHAWVAVNLVASSVAVPHDGRHIVRRHPEWLMVPAPLARQLHGVAPTSPAYLDALSRWSRSESDQIEGLFLSPILPVARQYTVDVIRDLVSTYAVDGIHFDYVRYPGEMFDYSAGALAAFRTAELRAVSDADRQRLDRQARTDPAAWTAALPQAWETFRRDQLSALVHALASAARSIRPHITVSSAVVPRAEEARARRLQDWPHWAAAGDLDAVCPMSYVTDDAEFASLVTRAKVAAGHVPVWAGIGAFKIPSGDAVQQIRTARTAGAGGIIVFSYDSAAAKPDYLGALRPALTGRWP